MSKERMTAVLKAIMDTQSDELTCDDLTPEQRSLYVESELAGEDPSLKYPRIAHHLRHCPDCAEEIDDLRLMLRLTQKELPQPAETPTFDLSFLQSERPVPISEVARGVVDRFFPEETRFYDVISKRFFDEVEKLRKQRASRTSRRPGWLEKLFSRRPTPGFAMGLSELKLPKDTAAPMTLQVLIAAMHMEEVLSSHRAALAKGEALPESVRRELANIGQEAELPDEVTEALIERLMEAGVEN
jgi:hypothetical protein